MAQKRKHQPGGGIVTLTGLKAQILPTVRANHTAIVLSHSPKHEVLNTRAHDVAPGPTTPPG